MGHGPPKEEVPQTTSSLPSFLLTSFLQRLVKCSHPPCHPPAPIPTPHPAVGMGVPVRVGRRQSLYRYSLLEWGCQQKFGPLQSLTQGASGRAESLPSLGMGSRTRSRAGSLGSCRWSKVRVLQSLGHEGADPSVFSKPSAVCEEEFPW